jgi:cytochrome c oxidase subunit I+III
MGFLLTFVFGGLTGVMVASVPFDLQVHDTYFVTAHFHYVLVGGVVFPIFAGIYYWFPKVVGRVLDERLGKIAFWLTFLGFNATFLLQHNLGLLGMRRRVHTFEPGLGWDEMNFISTVGAFVFAAGFVVILYSMWRAWRRGPMAEANPWGAGTLEWATDSPPASYNFRLIPTVDSREPLWTGAAEVRALALGDRLPEGAPDEAVSRETLATSLLDTRAVHNVLLPGPSLAPLWLGMALAIAGFGVVIDEYLLTAAGVVALPPIIAWWMWPRRDDLQPVAPGRTLAQRDLPYLVSGPTSTPWWGLVLGLGVVGLIVMNLIFSFLYLGVLAPAWPPPGEGPGPVLLPLVGLALVVGGALPMRLAVGAVRSGSGGVRVVAGLAGAAAAGMLALALLLAYALAHLSDPAGGAYAAMHAVLLAAQALTLLSAVGVAGAVAIQASRGMFDSRRFMAVDHAALIWYFVAAVWLVVFAVLHLLPPL